MPAADASLILTSEPLWAALFASALIGETMGPSDWAGGAVIIGACVLNELPKQNLPMWLRADVSVGGASGEAGE